MVIEKRLWLLIIQWIGLKILFVGSWWRFSDLSSQVSIGIQVKLNKKRCLKNSQHLCIAGQITLYSALQFAVAYIVHTRPIKWFEWSWDMPFRTNFNICLPQVYSFSSSPWNPCRRLQSGLRIAALETASVFFLFWMLKVISLKLNDYTFWLLICLKAHIFPKLALLNCLENGFEFFHSGRPNPIREVRSFVKKLEEIGN